jgi:Ca-activated chloride channel family protein
MRREIYFSLMILALAATALSQSNPIIQPEQQDRVVVGSTLVTLNVIVTDNEGHYVKGLTRANFEVYDNKVKRQIEHFSADASPVSIGIILEAQEGTTEKMSAVLTAIKEFTGTLDKQDEFFFVGFNDHGSVTAEFIPSAVQVLDYLKYVKPGDPFSLYDSVYFATNRLKQSNNFKKALLVISTGQDYRSQHNFRQLRNSLRTLDAQIYAIGITNLVPDQTATNGRWFFEDITRQGGRRSFLLDSDTGMGRAVLEEMSRASGGAAYFPQTESEPELAGICTQIALELREQYTLGFYSDETDSHKLHKLRVRVVHAGNGSDFTVSYREGYQVSQN